MYVYMYVYVYVYVYVYMYMSVYVCVVIFCNLKPCHMLTAGETQRLVLPRWEGGLGRGGERMENRRGHPLNIHHISFELLYINGTIYTYSHLHDQQ